VDESIAMAKRLEPLALDWLEEPCWLGDAASLARVAASTSIPIAAGENAGSLDELARIATVGRAGYIQPSAAKIGGITGLVAAQRLVSRLGVRLATHSAYFGPALAATIQFCAAFGLDCEWYDCRLETSPSGYIPVGGRFPLSGAPGLGVRIDQKLIDTYRVSP
jgi:L-alanine-DL-glutamate epimerase-like enolase superfamily enzyme